MNQSQNTRSKIIERAIHRRPGVAIVRGMARLNPAVIKTDLNGAPIAQGTFAYPKRIILVTANDDSKKIPV
jgi:hypothetical protein